MGEVAANGTASSYEREFEEVVAQGMADVEAGRTFSGTPDEVMAEVARRAWVHENKHLSEAVK